jgi:transposase
LKLSPTPNQVIVHVVDCFQHCQRDLREVESHQVLDLPPKRVVVIEHKAQQKCCPACQKISIAAIAVPSTFGESDCVAHCLLSSA